MDKITLTQPDDWHLHVRSGNMMRLVIRHTASQFGRAIIMPNLSPPVVNLHAAINYRNEIMAALPENSGFKPFMTLYLTEATRAQDIAEAAHSEHVLACKLYPAGATTNSEDGVRDIETIYPQLEAMQKHGMPLLVHGEVTGKQYDVFDREKIFIEQKLDGIVRQFPALRIVLEHATTLEAIQFVREASECVAATLTPQHLMYNRNALFSGGIRPHHYCLPIIKRETHRLALVKAAVSGNPKFFLGTDSAPHMTHLKEQACGCAGCYSAHAALEFYANIFEQEGALDKLEGFASFFGADFYRLPRNTKTVSLEKQYWQIPRHYTCGDVCLTPLKAGESLYWKLVA